VYNPDEIAIMSRALAFGSGDLKPHNFVYPTLFFYVLFGWMGVCYGLARLVGAAGSVEAFQAQFFDDPTLVYVAGRLLAVFCAVAAVVLVWRLGSRLFGRGVGLAAAVFLATAPYHVRDAHYVKHDVPVALALVVAMIAIARVWPLRPAGGRIARATVVAGLAVGLACSTHYYAVFVLLPLALAVSLRSAGHGGLAGTGGRLATAGLSAGVAFLVGSPFILADPARAWGDMIANRQIVVDRSFGAGAPVFASMGRYLELLWLDAAGWPVVALAAVGAVMLLARSPARAALLLSFPVAFLLFIGNTVAASRYLVPVLPWIAILAGYAVVRLAALAAGRGRRAVAAGLTVVAAMPGVTASLRWNAFFGEADTRALARGYIEAQVPPGSTVLLQPHSVVLRQSRASLVESLRHTLGSEDRASRKFQVQLALPPPPLSYRLIYLGDGGLDADKIYVGYGDVARAGGLDPIRRLGVHWLVVTRYNDPESDTRPFLDALPREARLVATFSPFRPGVLPETRARIEPFLHNTDARRDPALARPGPLIEIWRLDRTRPPVP
jgi:hypothetical protein